MRSTDTDTMGPHSSPLAAALGAPVRFTYVGEPLRRRWGRPGATLAGRYELEGALAARMPGNFWHARALRSGAARAPARVTVQLLDAALAEDTCTRQAFLEEAAAAAAIEHPQVARVLDFGIDADLDGGVPFLVLERLAGETLEDRLEAQPRPSPEELVRWFTEAAHGLHALHQRGMVHRRVDPRHWFLASEPRSSALPGTKLLFAIGDVLGDNLHLLLELSQRLGPARARRPDKSVGDPRAASDTREYQSPEQLLGHEPIDARSDLWSLAVIAFEALTGVPPFSGRSLGDRLVQICSGEAHPAPAGSGLPTGFSAWFQKGVRKLPAERFASAFELADGLCRLWSPHAEPRA